jgi:hypothetical protein
MNSNHIKLKLFKAANLVILLGFISRIFWSFSVQYREDEGVLLWLALTKNIPEVIFSNVTSKGIPNPNLAIFFLKTLTPLDSLQLISLFLSCTLGIIFYKALKTSNIQFNFVLLLSISLNSYLILTSSSIQLHLLTAVFNVLFLKIVFEYIFNKNYSYASYFPVITIIPFSIYLGGLINTVIYFLSFVALLILNLKKFKLNFSNKSLLFFNSLIFLLIIYVTWFRYFTFVDLDTFKIQNNNDGGSFLPYSRVRDYIFVGYQYTKKFPEFFLNVFSDKDTIYYPLNFDSKLDYTNHFISSLTFKFHKFLNLISSLLVLLGCFLQLTKFKTKVNKEFLNKSVLTLLFIYLYTVGSPLLGGRSYFNLYSPSLSVFSSVYILFVYYWALSLFIFKLDILRKISMVFFLIYFSINILLTVKTNIDFVNNISTYLTESDESSFHKEKIVDFIAGNTKTKENDVAIFFDLGVGFYNGANDFNKNSYDRDYYNSIYTAGREIEFLLKSKHNLDNSVDQISNNVSNSHYYIGYVFESFPSDVYENFQHFYFGNYRVTINLNYPSSLQ